MLAVARVYATLRPIRQVYGSGEGVSARDEFLDKLWHTLFARGVGGLVSPRAIRRQGQDRRRVRANELREVARVRRELQALLEGQLRIDDDGHLRETAPEAEVERVRMSPVVEHADAAQRLAESLDTVALLERARREQALEAVRRDLDIRHIAVMAEEESRVLPTDKLVSAGVDPDWMARWRAGVSESASVALKRYWARLLAGEVLRPGTYSTRTLEFFRAVSRTELEMLTICARFCFHGFIYRDPGRYFSPRLHYPLFQSLEELGLLRGVYGEGESWVLVSGVGECFRVILPCQHKAIFVEGDHPDDEVRIPAFRMTRFGREVFSLCRAEADTAYLAAVAGVLKDRGYRVQLGDWTGEGKQSLFTERMAL